MELVRLTFGFSGSFAALDCFRHLSDAPQSEASEVAPSGARLAIRAGARPSSTCRRHLARS